MTENHPDIRRTLLLLRDGDRVLLAMKKRGFGEGKWNGVGGKIEEGESIEQALVRETEEEVGVTPLSWEQVAELDFIQDAETANPWHMYVYAYICDSWTGNPIESEEMKPQWYVIGDFPYESLWDDDPHWMPQVLDGNKVFGTFTFDKHDRLLTHEVRSVEELPHESS